MTTEKISEHKVLASAAGYFVGREYWDVEGGYWGPWSRDSGYFRTREEAEAFVPEVVAGRGRVDAFARGSW